MSGKVIMSCNIENGSASEVADAAAALSARVELVDNWHVHWDEVLASVERLGQCQALHIDHDGWLSARQNLLVAFVGPAAVGHLCFRVQPMVDAGHGVVFTADGKAAVEACVECFGVADAYADQGIASLLIDRARARAVELHCAAFRMQPTSAA